jgi:protocatechuate 3,4-dioxygenase beta subunit
MKRKSARSAFIISIAVLVICMGVIKIASVSAVIEPWLNNDHSQLINSDWFTTSNFRDCPSDTCGIWPGNILDCILPEGLPGPSISDNEVVADPPDLFYKHLSPLNLTLSGESLIVGIYGGMCGTASGSLSIMVHPETELPKLNNMTAEERVEQYYMPFVLGATGLTASEVPLADVVDVYEAALFNCGTEGDGSGQGVFREFNGFTVVAQHWTGLEDCLIHVVDPSPPPTPSWTPTDTPTNTPTDTPPPTETPIPTDTPLPTDTPEPPTPTPVISIHVEDVYMSGTNNGKNFFIYTEVTILDEFNLPVSNATVELLMDDGTLTNDSVLTDENGIAMFTYKTKDSDPTLTSTVVNVTHTTMDYDPEANVEITDTYPSTPPEPTPTPETPTPEPTPTPTPTPETPTPEPEGEIHVGDISMWLEDLGKGNYNINTSVPIVDENGSAVQGAMVYISMDSGKKVTYKNLVTNELGVAEFSYKTRDPGMTLTSTVMDVTHSTYTYNPTANVETSETFPPPPPGSNLILL